MTICDTKFLLLSVERRQNAVFTNTYRHLVYQDISSLL